MLNDLKNSSKGDNRIQQQVDRHQPHCYIDRFPESLEEDAAENSEQEERDGHLILQDVGRVGIVDEVSGGVRGRERHRNDEIGGSESKQYQDEDFTSPTWEEPLKHCDAALAVGAGSRYSPVDR
jgi:hypothetical protein